MNAQTLKQVFFNRRMATLLGLGFASGLPGQWAMLGTPLQTWLIDHKVNVETIGLFGLIGVPFAFNFAWAPLLDRYRPPVFRSLGRRRGWLLLIQLLLFAALLALAHAGPVAQDQPLEAFAICGVLVAFFAATQDVLADAYRTDVLPEAELGAGAAVFVNGYRVAMLLASGGTLMLSQYMPWPHVFRLMAGLMLVGIGATLLAPRTKEPDAPPGTLANSFAGPVRDFFGRYGAAGLAMLAFVVLFKLPDVMARSMTMPLLLDDLKFERVQIAWIREWGGAGITMAGAFAGGALTAHLGAVRSLWLLALLQMLSNLGFTVLALTGNSVETLVAVVAVENFCGGMATAGFIAFLMTRCNRRFSATQYALFTSLNFATTLLASWSGYGVKWLGYPLFFAATVVVGVPGLLLAVWLWKRESGK